MKETVRSEILGDNVSIEEQPLQAGTIEDFDQHGFRNYRIGEDRLYVHPFDNGFHVIGDASPNSTFYPVGHKPELKWELDLGHRPTKEKPKYTFGQPDPAISLEFLGHPDRDTIVNLINQQKASAEAGIVIESEGYDSRLVRVVSASPVFFTNYYGIYGSYPQPSPTEEGYRCNVMAYIEVDSFGFKISSVPTIELRLATIGPDRVVRSYEIQRVGGNDIQRAPDEFTERLGVISAVFSDIARAASSKTDVKYRWLYEKGVPETLLRTIGAYLQYFQRDSDDPTSGWDQELRNDYKFSFLQLIKRAKKQDIALIKEVVGEQINLLKETQTPQKV